MSKEWFPWYPARFRADTMHLTAEQDGIYRRLIDHYMETGLSLPDNDAALARIAGVAADSWSMAAAMVRPFFKVKDGKLLNKKCEEVLRDQSARSHKNAVKGKVGAEKRWGKAVDKQGQNGSSHESANGGSWLADSTRQDKTRQKSNEEDDKEESSSSALKTKISFSYETGTFAGISEAQEAAWAAAYPAIDVAVETKKAAVWLTANPKNRKQNLARFLANWMAKQQERAPAQGGGMQSKPADTARVGPGEYAKNRQWYLRRGIQHKTYNPEGITVKETSA